MLSPVDTVSRTQCTVTAYEDGNALLTSKGTCAPTLLRQNGGEWAALYEGEMQWLSDGDQISLDASNPDSAIFICQSAMQQGYGY